MFQIVDTMTRETLGPNQSGELCIKGDHVMLGYANQKEASEQAFDDDGWLLTGMYSNYSGLTLYQLCPPVWTDVQHQVSRL